VLRLDDDCRGVGEGTITALRAGRCRLPDPAVTASGPVPGPREHGTGRNVMPNSSIKDEKTYEKVRKQGASKEKAARVANAAAGQGRSTVGKRGGRSSKYEDMSKQDLYDRAKEVGIKGRSSMNKQELVKALRDH
jgi:hypothetical protein